ncbi:MAG: carotenoid 1,2-hydratase [Desulfobacterales bacterium]|nr:carotenoid 1,2-hydratase [Desulfobacterales bacterium]
MSIRMFISLLSALGILTFSSGCNAPPQSGGTVNIAEALSSDTGDDCHEKATEPGIIDFPDDLGAHESFKTEWWYYTGNLKTETGRHFGFQLTFFRQALDCEKRLDDLPVEDASAWRTRQLYFAHFAVTDTQNRKFYSAQRMNRGSLGIAGVQSAPFKAWIDDWQAVQVKANGDTLRLTARARAENQPDAPQFSIHLTLTRQKPVILQGDRGLSRKGPGLPDASHYYSFPGMAAQGVVSVSGETTKASGHAWFDHEWSTSALGSDVAGWDWFALRINEGPNAGTDLMVCQVRRRDGRPNGYGFGAVSYPDGSYDILSESDFSIEAHRTWTSPATGRTYPSQWTIRLESSGLSLQVAPVVAAQEHSGMFPYYEGAVDVQTPHGGGLGYVEMTGY